MVGIASDALAFFHRQFGVARPLVPRARVVARAVPGGPQCERRERRARAGVAVRDDLLGVADPGADVIAGQRLPLCDEEILHVHVASAGDAPLAWIARITVLASELLVGADVDESQRRVVESP